MATKRIALYARVSTDGQTVENQLRELKTAAKRNKWKIVETFTDNGISGAKGRDQRQGFDALCKGIARRDFDMVAAWSVDRLGRSLSHLVTFLDELRAKDVDLYLHKQGLDTSTPAGRALFGMLSVFSEFERCMIGERIKAGLARAKSAGKHLGPPRRITDETREAVLEARRNNKSIRQIARDMKLGHGTVQRIIAG